MVWYRNAAGCLLIVLLLGGIQSLEGNAHLFFLPAGENMPCEEILSERAGLHSAENSEHSLAAFCCRFLQSLNALLLILFCLPITYYFIRYLSYSSLTPRLPPCT
jgi:hypothetical protein